MEVVEVTARKPANGTIHQSEWLQVTLSGVDEKMKAIMNLLENNLSPSQNSENHQISKESVKKMVQDLSLSYSSLAIKYERLKSISRYELTSTPSSPSNNQISQFDGSQDKQLSRRLDYSQSEAIYSNPESNAEDAEIEYIGFTHDFEHLNTFGHNMESKDEGKTDQESVWMDIEKLNMLKLVEENTQLQMELIRRNTEKQETIRKLQNQVKQLESENNALQRCVSYKQPVEANSPRKKASLDRFFRGCTR